LFFARPHRRQASSHRHRAWLQGDAVPVGAGLPAMRPGQVTLAAVAAQRFDDMRLGLFACYFYRGKTAGFSITTNLASCHFFPCHGLASCFERSCSFTEPRERWAKGRVSLRHGYKNAARGTRRHRAAVRPYWQASQSGSSIAQAFGTGAGPAAWTGALSPPLETALSLPVLMVDFSVLVAARARR